MPGRVAGMLDPRLLYDLDPDIWSRLRGSRPVLIHLLDGYVDAGQVGRTIGDLVLERYARDVMVRFDIDQLHDYRSRRPVMVFDTDQWKSAHHVRLDLHVCSDDTGQEFLLLRGMEPDSQWQRAVAALNHIVEHVDARLVVTASGAPMAVPHTRPTLVTRHTTVPDLSGENPPMIDRIEIPGSFSAYWELSLGQHDRRAMGFAVHVPHYLAQAVYHQAAVEAWQRIGAATGLTLDPSVLEEQAVENRREIDAEMAASAEVQEVVSELERGYDAMVASPEGSLPSADELGAEFERFLAQHDDDEHDDEDGRGSDGGSDKRGG